MLNKKKLAGEKNKLCMLSDKVKSMGTNWTGLDLIIKDLP